MKSLEVLMPILYLKGASAGDFEETLLGLLLGKDASGPFGQPASKAKRALQEIWMAETKKNAPVTFEPWSRPGPHNMTRRSNA